MRRETHTEAAFNTAHFAFHLGTGPVDVWFGAGFRTSLPIASPGSHSGSAMDGTYAIIIDGNGSVSERVLGHHSPGEH